MSADMMVVCEEDNSTHEGNSELAFFVDETSMGEPWNEFGKWFQSRFCGAPGMFEQLAGIKEHTFTLVTESDIVSIKHALEKMECHKSLDKEKFVVFLSERVGKHVNTENW